MVAGVERRKRTQPAREPGQRVDVDEPAVAAVLEVVMHRRPTQVGDPGAVEGRRHVGTAPASGGFQGADLVVIDVGRCPA